MTDYCPRAIENGGGPDSPHRPPYNGAMTWEARHGQRACSYCGSMHPDDFFAAAEAGAQLGPTDKNYKVYVDVAEPRVGQPGVFASANYDAGAGWVAVTAENVATLPQEPTRPRIGDWVRVSPFSATRREKFYFQHLSDEQQQRFIDLLNARKLNIGIPGHFYQPPFFVRFVKPEQS